MEEKDEKHQQFNSEAQRSDGQDFVLEQDDEIVDAVIDEIVSQDQQPIETEVVMSDPGAIGSNPISDEAYDETFDDDLGAEENQETAENQTGQVYHLEKEASEVQIPEAEVDMASSPQTQNKQHAIYDSQVHVPTRQTKLHLASQNSKAGRSDEAPTISQKNRHSAATDQVRTESLQQYTIKEGEDSKAGVEKRLSSQGIVSKPPSIASYGNETDQVRNESQANMEQEDAVAKETEKTASVHLQDEDDGQDSALAKAHEDEDKEDAPPQTPYVIDAQNLEMLDRMHLSSEQDQERLMFSSVGGSQVDEIQNLQQQQQQFGGNEQTQISGGLPYSQQNGNIKQQNEEGIAAALHDMRSVGDSENFNSRINSIYEPQIHQQFSPHQQNSQQQYQQQQQQQYLQSQHPQLDQIQWAADLTSEQRQQLADVLVDMQAPSPKGDNMSPQDKTMFGTDDNSAFLSAIQTEGSVTPHAFFPENLDGSSFNLNELGMGDGKASNLDQQHNLSQQVQNAYHKDEDVKNFKKQLDKRMNQAKKLMLSKHDRLADEFKIHELKRRVNCTYKMGGRDRKKTPALKAYERRVNELLYQDRFDRIQKDKSTATIQQSSYPKSTKSGQSKTKNSKKQQKQTVQHSSEADQKDFVKFIPNSRKKSVVRESDNSMFAPCLSPSLSMVQQQQHNVSSIVNSNRSLILAANELSENDKWRKQDQTRIKTMKMSNYFIASNDNNTPNLQRRIAHNIFDNGYNKNNEDLIFQEETENMANNDIRAIVKLRLQKPNGDGGGVVVGKPPKGSSYGTAVVVEQSKNRQYGASFKSNDNNRQSSSNRYQQQQQSASSKERQSSIVKAKKQQQQQQQQPQQQLQQYNSHGSPITKDQSDELKQQSLHEIELFPAPNIFHQNDTALFHEMIDAEKAQNFVKTLKDLKNQISDDNAENQQLSQNRYQNNAAVGSDIALSEAISYLDTGKISVNLTQYQQQQMVAAMENADESAADVSKQQLQSQSYQQATADQKENRQKPNITTEMDQEEALRPPRVSEKQQYHRGIKQKKREWNQFMRFMKKNPEALMGFVEQEPRVQSPKAFMLQQNPRPQTLESRYQKFQQEGILAAAQQPIDAYNHHQQPQSLLSLQHNPQQLRLNTHARPQSGKIYSKKLPFYSRQEFSTNNLDNIRMQRLRQAGTQLQRGGGVQQFSTALNTLQTTLLNRNELSSNGDHISSQSPDYMLSTNQHGSTNDQKFKFAPDDMQQAVDLQTQATEYTRGGGKESTGDPIIDLSLPGGSKAQRQSVRCSFDQSLNPIAEEVPSVLRQTFIKGNAPSVLSYPNLKSSLVRGGASSKQQKRRNIVSAQNRNQRNVNTNTFSTGTLSHKREQMIKKRQKSSKIRINHKLKSNTVLNSQVLSLGQYSPGGTHTIGTKDQQYIKLSSIPTSQLANNHGIQKLRTTPSNSTNNYPRRRAQTACTDHQKIKKLRLGGNSQNTVINARFRAANITTVKSSNSKNLLNQHSEVAFGAGPSIQNNGSNENQQQQQQQLDSRNLQDYLVAEPKFNFESVRYLREEDCNNDQSRILDNEGVGGDQEFSQRSRAGLSSKPRYPQDILNENQKLVLKSALREIGQPVGKKDVEHVQLWKRLSIKGLMDRVEHLFSIYPLTNAKILEKERRRLEAIRNKPEPPPYVMSNDLMAKLGVPQLDEFGPGGLYGYTRAQLLEMERLANLTPSSHTSSIQREQFQNWKQDVEKLSKEVILLEFDQKQELYTLQDIIQSINYLKN